LKARLHGGAVPPSSTRKTSVFINNGKEGKKGMDFSDISAKSAGELCEKLRQIKLRGGNTQPYLNSFISIETFDPAVLAPTQRYCLIKELKKIEQIRWDIMNEFGWDILQLSGYLQVVYLGARTSHGVPIDMDKVIDILPPIVEEYIDYRGNIKLIINDGQHRCRLAYQMGLPINVAYVRGSNKSYPYYAYPLPRGWDDVELRETIPEGYVKKFHVAKDHKALYRNFNSEFENIGDSRPYDSTEDKRIATYEKPIHKKGLDPEVEMEQIKKEQQEMSAGEYGVIGQCCMGKPGQEMIAKHREQQEKCLQGGRWIGSDEDLEKLGNNLSKAGCEAHGKYFSGLKLPELKDIDIYDYAPEEKTRELREKTGESLYYCKEALMESKGDMEKAIEYIKKRGWGPA
jgi:hypothetical protein